jgi:Acetyl-CoA hydrolase
MRKGYINGKIFTGDVDDPFAEAMVTEDGIIKWSGSAGEFDRSQCDGVTDLKGKTVIPGFVDCHMDHNDDIYAMPFPVVNDIDVIASNKRMISINSAIAIDLYGQVGAEMIGRTQYSAVGGQTDFVIGAQRSEGGKSIIAIESSYMKNGERHSKIVFDLAPGCAVTTPRSYVQYVATEYGCINLKKLTMEDRVRAMISLAHPDFRDQLTEQAKEYGLIRR